MVLPARQRRKVEVLEEALNDPLIRAEAVETLRYLLQRIVCTPDDQGHDGWRVGPHGDVAAILALAKGVHRKHKRPDLAGSGRLVSMVART